MPDVLFVKMGGERFEVAVRPARRSQPWLARMAVAQRVRTLPQTEAVMLAVRYQVAHPGTAFFVVAARRYHSRYSGQPETVSVPQQLVHGALALDHAPCDFGQLYAYVAPTGSGNAMTHSALRPLHAPKPFKTLSQSVQRLQERVDDIDGRQHDAVGRFDDDSHRNRLSAPNRTGAWVPAPVPCKQLGAKTNAARLVRAYEQGLIADCSGLATWRELRVCGVISATAQRRLETLALQEGLDLDELADWISAMVLAWHDDELPWELSHHHHERQYWRTERGRELAQRWEARLQRLQTLMVRSRRSLHVRLEQSIGVGVDFGV